MFKSSADIERVADRAAGPLFMARSPHVVAMLQHTLLVAHPKAMAKMRTIVHSFSGMGVTGSFGTARSADRMSQMGRYAELSIATPMHMSRLCTGDATQMTWRPQRRGMRRRGHSPNWT